MFYCQIDYMPLYGDKTPSEYIYILLIIIV